MGPSSLAGPNKNGEPNDGADAGHFPSNRGGRFAAKARIPSRWSAVPKIGETEGRLFVYLTRRQAFIVPRRAFEADDDFNAFAQAAKYHWKQHPRL